jgi:hypothetical protein
VICLEKRPRIAASVAALTARPSVFLVDGRSTPLTGRAPDRSDEDSLGPSGRRGS